MCLIVTHKQHEVKPFVNRKFYKVLLKYVLGDCTSLIRSNYSWKLGINKIRPNEKLNADSYKGDFIVNKNEVRYGLHVFTNAEDCLEYYAMTEKDSVYLLKGHYDFRHMVIEVFGNHKDLIAFGKWESYKGTYNCAAFTELRVDSFNDISKEKMLF